MRCQIAILVVVLAGCATRAPKEAVHEKEAVPVYVDSIEALLASAFRGQQSWRYPPQEDIAKLPLAKRNALAVALCTNVPIALDLLRDLASEGLINDPRVIEPLIRELEAFDSTDLPWELVQILQNLTGRQAGESLHAESDQPLSERVREVAAWWRNWWNLNRDKHPVMDREKAQLITRRVAIIESRLLKDLRKNYSELGHLHPDQVQAGWGENVFSEALPSESLAEGVSRDTELATFLYIKVRYATPLHEADLKLVYDDRVMPENWKPFMEEVFREELPGTDIVITVQAGSRDGPFASRVKESLSKLASATRRALPRVETRGR